MIDRKIASSHERISLPYIGLEDIESNQGNLIRNYSYTPKEMLATNFKFTANHILYGKLRPYLNKVLMPNFDGTCSTEILPLLPNEKIIKKPYLKSLLMNDRFVEWASKNVEGANLPRLSPDRLADKDIQLPPIEVQNKFDIICRKHDQIIRRIIESGRQADQLFQSLLNKAFQGEL
jgi:type I restriction enzyme S subunit